MTDNLELRDRLRALDKRQLGFIGGQLLDRLETEVPADSRVAEEYDKTLVRGAAEQLGLHEVAVVPDTEALVDVIIAASGQSPEARECLTDALARVREPDITLGPITFTVAAISLALVGAILRPRIKLESETTIQEASKGTSKSSGETSKLQFEFEFQGVPDIARAVRAAMIFLRGDASSF